jgi:hypothetical protein
LTVRNRLSDHLAQRPRVRLADHAQIDIGDGERSILIFQQQHGRPQRQVNSLRHVMDARAPVHMRNSDRWRDILTPGPRLQHRVVSLF